MKWWQPIVKWIVKINLIVGGILVVLKLIMDAVSDTTDTEAEEVTAKVDEIIIATSEKKERVEAAKVEHKEILKRKEVRDKAASEFFPGL